MTQTIYILLTTEKVSHTIALKRDNERPAPSPLSAPLTNDQANRKISPASNASRKPWATTLTKAVINSIYSTRGDRQFTDICGLWWVPHPTWGLHTFVTLPLPPKKSTVIVILLCCGDDGWKRPYRYLLERGGCQCHTNAKNFLFTSVLALVATVNKLICLNETWKHLLNCIFWYLSAGTTDGCSFG